MLGQLNFFAVRSPDKAPLAIDRFHKEGERLLRVLETRLSATAHIGGPDYSIADVATYPWIVEARDVMAEPLAGAFASLPAIKDWLARVGERPAVKTGMRVLEDRPWAPIAPPQSDGCPRKRSISQVAAGPGGVSMR